MVTIAINGFGRIGRVAARILLARNRLDRLVAVNDLSDAATLAHLLKYDSNYGTLADDVLAITPTSPLFTGSIRVGHHAFGVIAEKEPSKLPWKDLGVDIVIESTGRFTDQEAARQHLEAGAKQVIISAPSKGDISAPTSVIGVNAGANDGDVLSNASCTTNCIAPMIAVLDQVFGVEKALMTTVHAYTASQMLQDGPAKDLREARAAAQNIVPTSTGAAIATSEVLPQLRQRFDGVSIRVPVPVGSLADITAVLRRPTTKEEINAAFTEASRSRKFSGILEVTTVPLVSSDIVGSSASAIVDLDLTRVVDGTLVKVFGWYDNEWGYTNRLIDQVFRLSEELDQTR